MSEFVPRCECCGDDGSFRSLTMLTTHRDTKITCTFCQGLLDVGLIREEWIGGVRRFRQWSFEWKPGDLVPRPKVLA